MSYKYINEGMDMLSKRTKKLVSKFWKARAYGDFVKYP